MHELLIYRDGKKLTYSEALILQDQMRAAVAASRRKRTDVYANIEVDFSKSDKINQSALVD